MLLADLLQRLDVLEQVVQRLLMLIARDQLQEDLLVQQVRQEPELSAGEWRVKEALVAALLLQHRFRLLPVAGDDLRLDALDDGRSV